MKHKPELIVGTEFTYWTVLDNSLPIDVLCKCRCSKTRLVNRWKLMQGRSKSCGCANLTGKANTTHGMTRTPTFKSWETMKSRCSNLNDPSYSHYGGRGISYPESWERFEGFLADMGVRPTGTTLGRIDNDGNYSRENCRWETPAEQNNNKSNNHPITINSETKNICEWASQSDISMQVINWRINKGWPAHRWLKAPRIYRKKK